MTLRKVTAIIRDSALGRVEGRLQALGVKGITITRVRGFGEYKDFYHEDWISTHSRIEIFTSEERAEACVAAILETAWAGLPGDGIVAVLPVEKLYRIRERREAGADEI